MMTSRCYSVGWISNVVSKMAFQQNTGFMHYVGSVVLITVTGRN